MTAEKLVKKFFTNHWSSKYDRTFPFTMKQFYKKFTDVTPEEAHVPLGTFRWVVTNTMSPEYVKPIKEGSGFWLCSDIEFEETQISQHLLPIINKKVVTYMNLTKKVNELLIEDNQHVHCLPHGYVSNLHRKLKPLCKGLEHRHVSHAVYILKAEKRIDISKPAVVVDSKKEVSRYMAIKNSKSSGIEEIRYILTEKGFNRSVPAQENRACRKIESLLLELPFGGGGLLFGTATPISVANDEVSKYLIMDNLSVHNFLDRTTAKDIPTTIVVGNYKDPEKAKLKINYWNMIDMCASSRKIEDIVDEYSLISYVSQLVALHDIVKVVILTSGSWTGKSHKESGLDANFEKASKRLVVMFPNVHILAMVRNESNTNFDVRYLNRDINKLHETI